MFGSKAPKTRFLVVEATTRLVLEIAQRPHSALTPRVYSQDAVVLRDRGGVRGPSAKAPQTRPPPGAVSSWADRSVARRQAGGSYGAKPGKAKSSPHLPPPIFDRAAPPDSSRHQGYHAARARSLPDYLQAPSSAGTEARGLACCTDCRRSEGRLIALGWPSRRRASRHRRFDNATFHRDCQSRCANGHPSPSSSYQVAASSRASSSSSQARTASGTVPA